MAFSLRRQKIERGQDPEIRYTPTGLPVVNFSVATNEVFLDKEDKRQERAEWHRIVVMGKVALTCNEYLKKGRQVFVEGRLQTREWESNGQNSRRTEIVAARVQFLGPPPREGIDEVSEEPTVSDDGEVPV
jgi:single-strand DNA-binding protein